GGGPARLGGPGRGRWSEKTSTPRPDRGPPPHRAEQKGIGVPGYAPGARPIDLLNCSFMSGVARGDALWPIPRASANYQFCKLHVLVTNRCNFTCGMCSIIHQARDALTEQQLRGLIEAADQLGFDEIEISGGEPYYLPYFRKVLEDYAGSTQATLKVCTNAFQMDEGLVRTLAGRPRLHFQVSFDGTRDVHNDIRVQNRYDAFPRSDRNLRLLAEAGIMTSLNTVIQ